MNLFPIKEKVREKLSIHEQTRDNDNLLIAMILEDIEDDLESLTGRELVEKLKNGEYGCLDSIGRARRGLQEKYESLRGDKWKQRHDVSKAYAYQMRFEF